MKAVLAAIAIGVMLLSACGGDNIEETLAPNLIVIYEIGDDLATAAKLAVEVSATAPEAIAAVDDTPTTKTAAPVEENDDLPSQDDLIKTATAGGKDFFDMSALDMMSIFSERCTQTLSEVAGDLSMAQGFLGELDSFSLQVRSIEYSADGLEAAVVVDWVDPDGNVIDLGDAVQERQAYFVEDGEWRHFHPDCMSEES